MGEPSLVSQLNDAPVAQPPAQAQLDPNAMDEASFEREALAQMLSDDQATPGQKAKAVVETAQSDPELAEFLSADISPQEQRAMGSENADAGTVEPPTYFAPEGGAQQRMYDSSRLPEYRQQEVGDREAEGRGRIYKASRLPDLSGLDPNADQVIDPYADEPFIPFGGPADAPEGMGALPGIASPTTQVGDNYGAGAAGPMVRAAERQQGEATTGLDTATQAAKGAREAHAASIRAMGEEKGHAQLRASLYAGEKVDELEAQKAKDAVVMEKGIQRTEKLLGEMNQLRARYLEEQTNRGPSDGAKIGASIAIILSGMGQGGKKGGGGNFGQTMGLWTSIIGEEAARQQRELSKIGTGHDMAKSAFQASRLLLGDEKLAADHSRLMIGEVYKAKLDEVAKRSGSRQMRLLAEQAATEVEMAGADAQTKFGQELYKQSLGHEMESLSKQATVQQSAAQAARRGERADRDFEFTMAQARSKQEQEQRAAQIEQMYGKPLGPAEANKQVTQISSTFDAIARISPEMEGLGFFSQKLPAGVFSDAGVQNKVEMARLINSYRLMITGQAAAESELQRLLGEIGSGTYGSAKQLRTWMENTKQDFVTRGAVLVNTNPAAVQSLSDDALRAMHGSGRLNARGRALVENRLLEKRKGGG